MSSVLLVCKQDDVIRGLADILRAMNFSLIDAANSAAKGGGDFRKLNMIW